MFPESVLQDVRFALRQLRRSPTSAIFVILTLSLAIAANTAIFSLVNAWLLRPLPLKDPQQLVSLWRTAAGNPHEPAYFDLYHDYLIWAAENHTLQSLAATFPQEYTVTGSGEARQIHGAIASWNLFATVGAEAQAGRLFGQEDINGAPACVISYAFWHTQFGGTRDIVGRTIRLNGAPYRVLGVLPAKFSLRVLDRPFEIDAWTLITAGDANHTTTSPAPVSVIGRLQPAVTEAQAEADLNGIQRELNRRFADEPRDSGVLVSGLQRDNTRTIRSSLLLLTAAVGVLLLIASVNAGSLILGRNSQRAREFVVRLALGCRARRLMQQLATEILLLFAVSGVCGVGGTFLLLRFFTASNTLGVLPAGGISIDATVLVISSAAIGLAALLFGLAPAMRAVRLMNADALRAPASSAGRAHLHSRMGFVVAEIALSVVLLVAAGLLISSFARLATEPLGFETRDVYVSEITLPLSTYGSVKSQASFIDQLMPKLRAMPSVRFAGVSTTWPFQANGLSPVQVDGRTAEANDAPRAFTFNAGPGYLSALGVVLLEGREFRDTDGPSAPAVAVINDAMARRAFPGESPLGQRIRIGSLSDKQPNTQPWLTVIGVIANTSSMRYNHSDWDREPAVYTAFLQRQDAKNGIHGFETQTIYVVLQAKAIAAAELATAVHQIDADIPVSPLRTTATIVSELSTQPRLRAVVLGSLALLTLLLAAVGVYGVMAQFVEQRRREIGIRIAVGATPSDVVRHIVHRTMLLIAVGLACGMAGAAATSRLLRALLYQVSPFDPATFAVVPAILFACAAVASYLPAKRAARIDPIITLRSE